MAIQSLDQFKSSFGSAPVEVEFPEFARDGESFSVFLRPLKSADRDNFEASIVGDGSGKGRDLRNLRAKLVALVWCDENGEPIGTAKEIGELRADFIGALFDKARAMNGMDADDVEEAGKD